MADSPLTKMYQPGYLVVSYIILVYIYIYTKYIITSPHYLPMMSPFFIFKEILEKYNIPLKDSRVLAHFIKIISRNPVKNNEIFL